MTSIASGAPPLHQFDSQPDNLLASSDIANESYVSPRILSEVMDQPQAQLPIQTASKVEMSNGTTEHDEVPPFQPESKPVKDNKAVPWYA